MRIQCKRANVGKCQSEEECASGKEQRSSHAATKDAHSLFRTEVKGLCATKIRKEDCAEGKEQIQCLSRAR